MDKKITLYIPLIEILFHPNPSPHQTRSQVLLQETKAENPYQYIKVVKKYTSYTIAYFKTLTGV